MQKFLVLPLNVQIRKFLTGSISEIKSDRLLGAVCQKMVEASNLGADCVVNSLYSPFLSLTEPSWAILLVVAEPKIKSFPYFSA